MKKFFLILAIFLLSIKIYGFTQKEKIQNTLSKIGVNQEIIDETIKLNYEIRDTQYFEDDEKVVLQRIEKLKKLFVKDERNYIISQNLITIFGERLGKDYKHYLDLFIKYTPYDYEKIFSKMIYSRDNGDISTFQNYMNQISRTYKNTPVIIELAKLFTINNFEEKQIQTEKVINLLKEEKEREKIGVSDEEYHFIRLTYFLNKIRNYYDNGEIEKAVSEYLKNVNNIKVSDEVKNYNLRAEVILYSNVVLMNEQIQDDLKKAINTSYLEDTWIAAKIKEETEKDSKFLDKMLQ
ncbi:hypothetical protein J5A73_04905 [Leptotrichia sp. oral taxon 218]|jgi:hypothetical protein|uniref:hypothetical protein n=1 Tax=Leptotrichia sp. oral taxon 218 TaxID=712361 RepID=UPI001B8C4EC4|nr:hypothetical protein [Leptotrichia sp. oral taxon 218]QUB96175.1 hypothetical protein J5A73_04905 [Leptotrichia sp. oral taxon 218]